jgi:outer membrane protein assembly factor BamB
MPQGGDGTVFVGNLFGQVLAFSPDGAPLWSRQLPAGQWVAASPVIGADGSVYADGSGYEVSETRQLVPGTTSDFSYQSTLSRFSAAGDILVPPAADVGRKRTCRKTFRGECFQ